MTEWIIQVTVDTARPLDEQHLAALAQAAEETRDGSVARRSDGPGYVMIVSVEDEDPVTAAQAGVRFARDELGVDLTGTVVDLRVNTPERFEAEALRPDFPPLASAADAAEILGVSRQRVHQLAASNTRFPAPVARVATGLLWAVPAIEHFARVWDRRPGRRHDAATVRPLRPVATARHDAGGEREYSEG